MSVEMYPINLRNVAVDQLNHDQCSVVSHDVEGLGLDVGVLVGLPAQIILGQDSVGGLLSLLGDRLDGIRAIDGLLRTHGRRKTAAYILISCPTKLKDTRERTLT